VTVMEAKGVPKIDEVSTLVSRKVDYIVMHTWHVDALYRSEWFLVLSGKVHTHQILSLHACIHTFRTWHAEHSHLFANAIGDLAYSAYLSAHVHFRASLFHSMVEAIRLLQYVFSQRSIRANLNGKKKRPESMSKTLYHERSRFDGILSSRLMCATR